MQKQTAIAFVLLALLALAVCTPAASARYPAGGAENTGIENNDIIFQGERNLDFSAFSWDGYTVDAMVKRSGGSISATIPLVNQKGDIGSTVETGTYMPYNATSGKDGTKICTVADLTTALGRIAVMPFGGPAPSDPAPSSVPKGLGIVFYLSGGSMSLLETQLSGNWNTMTLKNTATSVSASEIKNLAGTVQSLAGITKPSDTTNPAYAFRLADQTTLLPATGTTPMQTSFEVNLNGLKRSVAYTFNAVQTVLGITVPAEIARGVTRNITITGTPYTAYDLTLPDTGADTPVFLAGGTGVVFIDDHHLLVTPDWTGSGHAQLNIPSSAKTGSYQITLASAAETKTASFRVVASTVQLFMDAPSNDMTNGLFAVGDGVKLRGTISKATDSTPVYLFITGPGLPENGVNLEGGALTDGDNTTFTETTYSVIFGEWVYMWDTNRFSPGTYTVHANLDPYGFTESSTPTGKGYANHVSHEHSLSDQSIHAKFSDKTSARFTQGDIFYSSWVARGSPGAETAGSTEGKIRWYIIGTNFRYADMNDKVPLYTNDQTPGVDAPAGEYGFTYPRSFTSTLDAGSYYLIYQHPGPDNVFDVTPDVTGGAFSAVTTTYGEGASLGTMQSDNAANTLTELISKPLSDDLFVITRFTIDTPQMSIEQIPQSAIGTKIQITGTTNYAGADKTADKTEVGDSLSLRINRLEFGGTEENTAMKLAIAERVTPLTLSPYAGTRTFAFDEIDTSTWFEGTYQAKVTNVDTGVSASMTFTISGDGISSDIPAPTLTPAVTSTAGELPLSSETAAPTAVPTKSPGFLLLPLGLIAAAVLGRK